VSGRLLAALGAAVLVLAGCGGSRHAAPPATTSCRTKAQTRALAKLDRDLAALKAAGRVHVKNRLLGGSAASHATDRFLLDLAKAPISNLTRNRLIDHAAASVVGNCQQCFQALEAERPIPSIAHGENASGC
jgi:hypothetical protein